MDTLTESEQREIRKYLRDRLAGNEINIDSLPQWLADLEKARAEVARLTAENARLTAWQALNLGFVADHNLEGFVKLMADWYEVMGLAEREEGKVETKER